MTGGGLVGDVVSGITAMLNRLWKLGLAGFGGRRVVGVVGEREVARLRIGCDDDDIERDGFLETGGGGGGGGFL